jgi:MoxR-like ATPase
VDPAFAEAHRVVDRMRAEVRKVVVGQDEVIDHTLAAFLAGGSVLIEGVPGLGKTLLVLALARTFGGEFARIQFTPDLMPSDVTGHSMYDPSSGEFRVRKGPAFTNLLLADEINRAPAKTQAALLEVMQEHRITIEGEAFPTPVPFMALATQNPIEQEGTYPLPEAQLDRFLLKVHIDYPTLEEEHAVVRAVTGGRVGDTLDVEAVQQVVSPEQARELQRRCAQVRVDERVVDYAVRIARATRTWSGVSVGAGPRGAIALIRVARVQAVLEGRDFVIPDDVKALATPALRHRIVIAPELEIEGLSADDVLRTLLDQVEAPRQ